MENSSSQNVNYFYYRLNNKILLYQMEIHQDHGVIIIMMIKIKIKMMMMKKKMMINNMQEFIDMVMDMDMDIIIEDMVMDMDMDIIIEDMVMDMDIDIIIEDIMDMDIIDNYYFRLY